MTEEESSIGSVKWATYKSYLIAAGGILVIVPVTFLFLIAVSSVSFSNIWLSYWLRDGSGVRVTVLLHSFSSIILIKKQ